MSFRRVRAVCLSTQIVNQAGINGSKKLTSVAARPATIESWSGPNVREHLTGGVPVKSRRFDYSRAAFAGRSLTYGSHSTA